MVHASAFGSFLARSRLCQDEVIVDFMLSKVLRIRDMERTGYITSFLTPAMDAEVEHVQATVFLGYRVSLSLQVSIYSTVVYFCESKLTIFVQKVFHSMVPKGMMRMDSESIASMRKTL